jgi:hypothetical protein
MHLNVLMIYILYKVKLQVRYTYTPNSIHIYDIPASI